LGKSIARSMGRAFSAHFLGGVRDEADIRGHRKTYVGAFQAASCKALKPRIPRIRYDALTRLIKLASDHA